MKKRLFVLFLTVAFMLGCTVSGHMATAAPADAFAGGDGSKENPYLISDADGLKELATSVSAGETYSGKYLRLTADIDLANVEWAPIGVSTPFEGNFDGDGHTVSGLTPLETPSGTRTVSGLFGTISGATVQNLTVEGEMMHGAEAAGDIVAGGIAAVGKDSVLENVHVQMDIGGAKLSGQGRIGGLIGLGDGERITMRNCSFDGTIALESATYLLVGGLIGSVESGDIDLCGCKVSGSVSLTQDAATLRLGGVTGRAVNGNIADTVVTAALSGSTGEGSILRIGGVIGDQYATKTDNAPGLMLSSCAFVGSISSGTGTRATGGIVGNANTSGACSLTRCVSVCDGLNITPNLNQYIVTQSVGLNDFLRMQAGAAVLGASPTDIRWSAEFDRNAYASLQDSLGEDAVSVGMLIAPNDSVLAAGTFTREALASVDGAVLDVPYSAEEWYAETTEAYVFTGGTEALAEEDHHTQYAAVAYVTIRLSEATGITVYADCDESNIRSVEYVAYMAYHDRAGQQADGYSVEIPAEEETSVDEKTSFSPYRKEMLEVLKTLFGSFVPAES